ncbi:GH92 family glycosyl hydrolase [Stackebrandtia nassauensis]|uniref:Alpha-1,2-mannosidase n=1 Tax=Stackebrandtia nassauensis (strain DSM 44728 / CIP 108903 / NRRL B-16338 / NBRC 102104 / LLR-40K-21) TaxID=446470 RepID=D3Q0N4_STANL|nr:GH92 family glycosyl hydrolase [Stackebrandtia nassauensis]ADD41770.1 alpha-1,2-mannosidase [Stackebrandtia nassauensis DSM 44728]
MPRQRLTRWITVLACSALTLVLMPPGRAAAADGTDFDTSFEDGQSLPDWENSVENDRTGGLDGTMKSARDTGPAESPTAKAKVGYTGTRSASISGNHTSGDRGFSYNKLLDTDIEVTETSELSYLIFPKFVENAPANPSTFAAVDLAFTDGTYLSELGAVDQHGAKVDPTSQGKSETLYTGQWNRKAVPLGEVAAGKTIDRILLAYDNPDGPATFTDYFDDIRVVGEPEAPDGSPADYALTTRGTQSSGDFSRGNNFPATAVPHGFNFYTPVTDAGSTSWLYQHHRANNAANRPELQAFSVSHEPSPWMGDRQTFQVMPSTALGTPDADRKKRALPFGHDKEIAKPHHYGVMFDNGLSTDIAPANHSGLFQFSFPDENANLIFDNVKGDGGLTLNVDDGVVTGYSDVKSGLSTGATRMFVYAEFDDAATKGDKLSGGGGEKVAGYMRFDAGDDRTVTMRLGTSLLSVEQARKNMESEIGGKTFDEVRGEAEDQWNDKLGVIEVEGASQDQLTTLYSNLYRLFLYPNIGHENVGTPGEPKFRYASPVRPPAGNDTPTETGATVVDGEMFVNNGFWDTYRTTWPAYALFDSDNAGNMMDGFVQQYRDGGWISRWSSPGYADLMVGTSSDVAFADAYLKGVEDFDVESAYDAAVKNATVAPPEKGVGRKGLETSIFDGYTSTETREGMSWALEGYVNDFGIANMSKKLYEADQDGPRAEEYKTNYEYFLNRAQNYVNMFDDRIGFFQGKDASGDWRVQDPGAFNPAEWGHDYTETNAWNMAFTVPQDGRGLANLYGGRDKLASKLDKFFTTPEMAKYPGSYPGVIHEMREARDTRMGMYGHSNQPSHHIPWMYDYVGQPWKTQALTREATSRLYLGSEIGQGYPGDEDNGEMSAWWLFSALGFYPLQMGSENYALGSPLFTKATVHLDNGKDIVVNAPANNAKNVYVQGLKVNGKAHKKAYLDSDTLTGGATLDFAMGAKPSDWASSPSAAPPSITKDDKIPDPLKDAAKGATTTTPEAFDDSSKTAVTSDGGELTVEAALSKPTEPRMYTLTSASKESAPTAWRLEGSADGTNWATLETRDGENFKWDKQTRSFLMPLNSGFKKLRIVVTETAGDPAALSEVEFLV